jgi:hypothetical protein
VRLWRLLVDPSKETNRLILDGFLSGGHPGRGIVCPQGKEGSLFGVTLFYWQKLNTNNKAPTERVEACVCQVIRWIRNGGNEGPIGWRVARMGIEASEPARTGADNHHTTYLK